MTAKEFLMKLPKMNNDINQKQTRLSTLRSVAYNTSPNLSADVVQRTRDKSPLESIMVKIVDLDREINKCVDAFVDYKAVVWEQLDKLTDEREKQILWLRYAEEKTWNNISTILYLTPRHIMRIHKSALNNLEKINSFMQLITDYVDYREIDTEKTTQANIIATFYEINRNKPHILNLCYECLEKIDNTAELLQDLNIK